MLQFIFSMVVIRGSSDGNMGVVVGSGIGDGFGLGFGSGFLDDQMREFISS